MEYISFWKGLTTGRLVLIRNTIKEMTKVFHLLDVINLRYDIIVNKFDSVDFEERESFKEQIHDEIKLILSFFMIDKTAQQDVD